MIVATLFLVMAAAPLASQDGSPAIIDRPDGRLEDDRAARAYVIAGASSQLGIHSPGMAISRSHDMRFQYSVTSFHRVWAERDDGVRAPHWLVRRREANWRDVTTRYADSRTCPGIESALTLAAEIEPPILPSPRFGEPDIILDDWAYAFTATGIWPTTRAYAEFTLSGGSTSPLAPLWQSTDALLATCWMTTPPSDRDG